MKTEYTGTVHGRTIELTEAPGLPDGQRVTVVLQTEGRTEPTAEQMAVARAALERAAGGWKEDAEELDKYLEWNRQQRKLNRPELPE